MGSLFASVRFPPRSILHFVNNEYFSFPEKLHHDLVQFIGVPCLEPDEPIFLEVNIIKLILFHAVGELRQ